MFRRTIHWEYPCPLYFASCGFFIQCDHANMEVSEPAVEEYVKEQQVIGWYVPTDMSVWFEFCTMCTYLLVCVHACMHIKLLQHCNCCKRCQHAPCVGCDTRLQTPTLIVAAPINLIVSGSRHQQRKPLTLVSNDRKCATCTVHLHTSPLISACEYITMHARLCVCSSALHSTLRGGNGSPTRYYWEV